MGTKSSQRKKLPLMPVSVLHEFVESFFNRREIFLNASKTFGSPLYLLENQVLRDKAEQFRGAFEGQLPATSFYYAMKSNSLPDIAKIMLEQGFGLDVSGGPELECALRLGASDIIFSGPGKTQAELKLAVDNNNRTTILLDSASELKRLKTILDPGQKPVRVGIRLNSNPDGLWRKFGIQAEDLLPLFQEISRCREVRFTGLQFHSSWNLTPDRQVAFIRILGDLLTTMPPRFLESLKFIDIGGGYWPPQGEWLISEDPLQHLQVPADPLETFAEQIGNVIKETILPVVGCRVCFEPGRWICNDAMHILIRVIDRKAPDLVICDAGTNAVGWERFETDYFPVLNLSSPGMAETPCHVLGSLCTPHDVWGYACFGDSIQEGDILMIPTQGAYTYSLRQHFIKALPAVAVLEQGVWHPGMEYLKL